MSRNEQFAAGKDPAKGHNAETISTYGGLNASCKACGAGLFPLNPDGSRKDQRVHPAGKMGRASINFSLDVHHAELRGLPVPPMFDENNRRLPRYKF